MAPHEQITIAEYQTTATSFREGTWEHDVSQNRSNHRLDSRDATLDGYSEGNPIMSIQPYTVEAFWDTEAAVWVATSETILGLVTEAETIEDLTQKLRSMIPDLLELNHLADFNAVKSIEIELITHRNEQIQIAA